MASIRKLEERAGDVRDYIGFGNDLLKNLEDPRISKVVNNLLAQLKRISDIYQRAIQKGENPKYSTEDLKGMREAEFAEIGLYRWLLEEYATDSKTAFKTLDEPEILAYSLLLILKDKYAPWIKEV